LCNNHEDKDASFLCKANRLPTGPKLSATETKYTLVLARWLRCALLKPPGRRTWPS
jgi:hypothetical protein